MYIRVCSHVRIGFLQPVKACMQLHASLFFHMTSSREVSDSKAVFRPGIGEDCAEEGRESGTSLQQTKERFKTHILWPGFAYQLSLGISARV